MRQTTRNSPEPPIQGDKPPKRDGGGSGRRTDRLSAFAGQRRKDDVAEGWGAPRMGARPIALHAAIMLACWAVYLIALYPGSMSWDTYYQITQCYLGDYPVWVIPWEPSGSLTDAWFSDHHPLFDTLLYGLFARVSDHFTGSWNGGVFCFVVLQSVATAAVFATSVAYLGRLGVPKTARRGIFAFFCLAPFFPFYAATMMKDSLFSPLFVVYFLMVLECARTRGESLAGSGKATALFIAIGLLLALTKKPGMHIVVLSAIVLGAVFRNAWRAYAAQVAIVVAVMTLVLPLVVFPLLRVVPGGTQETLGPLFQQTARFAALYPDEATPDEREAIDRVLGYEDLAARYDPANCDPVKFGYRYGTCTSSDLLDYLRVWAAQGARHPDAYIAATLDVVKPFFDLDGSIGVIESTGDAEHAGSELVHRPEALAPLLDGIVGLYHMLAGLPVISALFKVGLYVWVIPLVTFCALASKRSRYAAALVPVGFSVLVCLASPAFDARYALPLIEVAPLLTGLCFLPDEEEAPIAHPADHGAETR